MLSGGVPSYADYGAKHLLGSYGGPNFEDDYSDTDLESQQKLVIQPSNFKIQVPLSQFAT